MEYLVVSATPEAAAKTMSPKQATMSCGAGKVGTGGGQADINMATPAGSFT